MALWTYTPLLHLWMYTPPPWDVYVTPMGRIRHTSYIICTSLYVETNKLQMREISVKFPLLFLF